MDFTVNEQGCRNLSADMLTHLRQILTLISEIDSRNSTLRGALGEDYEAIAKTVRVMTAELDSAYQELQTIISQMEEYMRNVRQVRVFLN